MSFTIYQNNEKKIEIITRAKMGSSTLQHPGGVMYNKISKFDLRHANRDLNDGWIRFDGYEGENNNNHFGPTSFDNLTWLKYLDTNNTKYFLYRNPIQKYASGLTQLYLKPGGWLGLIVPEGMDPNNPQKHLVLPSDKELDRAKPGTKSVNPNYVRELLHYYQTQPDSFFENYGNEVEELDPSHKNRQYVDPHVNRGLIHAVILKFLLPRKTRLTLLENLDPLLAPLLETLNDSSLKIYQTKGLTSSPFPFIIRANVTNDSYAIQPGFALDMHNIQTTMAKRFNDVITNESTDYYKFLSLEIKIWEELENNSEPLSILKMVVTELESNNLPIVRKPYYEQLIECFRKQYGII
jgi:hypothetical protein